MKSIFETYAANGLQAIGTITIASVPAAGDTVTIDGVVYTAGTNFRITGAHNQVDNTSDIARSLVAAINDEPSDRLESVASDTITPTKSVWAVQYDGNKVVVVARVPGTAGNSITLATSAALVFVLSGATLSGGVAGAAIGSVTATTTPSAGALTDRSGSITTGGTRQQVMAANTSRKYLVVANPSDTTMYIKIGANAVSGEGIPIYPGGAYEPGPFIPTGTVDIICATTGKKFTAYEA